VEKCRVEDRRGQREDCSLQAEGHKANLAPFAGRNRIRLDSVYTLQGIECYVEFIGKQNNCRVAV
jgi:hypothetical protein